MNLSKLFEMQKALDEKIIKEKGLEGQDLLPQKILALQVELGECANEWRGFKFWSQNQSPRVVHKGKCTKCDYWEMQRSGNEAGIRLDGTFCDCYVGLMRADTVLEEYVDCLHFILSIGLHIDADEWCDEVLEACRDDITEQFIFLGGKLSDFYKFKTHGNYNMIIDYFFGLGEMLGFTWGQIEQAYISKNEVNHQRQQNGY